MSKRRAKRSSADGEARGQRHRAKHGPIGTAPGSLQIPPGAPAPEIHVMAYGPDRLEERTVGDVSELRGMIGRWPVVWVNVFGMGDAKTLVALRDMFGLHPLALEDVVNVNQRAKVEPYGDHLFVVTRMVSLGERLETEQLSLFLGEGFVLSFQEHPGDCLEPVRDRLRKKQGRVRGAGADYLVYALLDAVVDAYYPVLESYGERIEVLEERVIAWPNRDRVRDIRGAKRDLLALRRAIWPQRESINSLIRDAFALITDDTRLYLRDCYDHVTQLIDAIETNRELAWGLQDVYLSSLSNRMNEVMRVLTVIATIFIPLTFIAGIYGMNFDPEVSPWNMPELSWPYGYPVAIAVMVLLGAIMAIAFWRRGWLSDGSDGNDEP